MAINKLFKTVYDEDYDYEKDFAEKDFVVHEQEPPDDFDYDGARIHKYDDYEGDITVEIALQKYEALVRHYALKYSGGGAEYDELMQIGMEGLLFFVPGHEKDKYLSAYLKKRIRGHILNQANRLRNLADYEHRLFIEDVETIGDNEKDSNWGQREKAMFDKLATILSNEEMKTVQLLYAGCSLREAGKRLGITHCAVKKRLEKIRMKILPHISWFEDRIYVFCYMTED